MTRWGGIGEYISQDELALFRVMISRFFPLCNSLAHLRSKTDARDLNFITEISHKPSVCFVSRDSKNLENVFTFSVEPPSFIIAACRIGYTRSNPWKTDKY